MQHTSTDSALGSFARVLFVRSCGEREAYGCATWERESVGERSDDAMLEN